MPLTPQITLTATLDDFSGNVVGSTALPSALKIALCGYGATLPVVPTTCVIAKPGPFVVQTTTGTISVKLWGNDVIVPSGTYYTITVLDERQNDVQCGIYQFTGTQTIDLSNAPQIVPPLGTPPLAFFRRDYFPIAVSTSTLTLSFLTFSGSLIALFYNGIYLRPGGIDYTLTGTIIALTFTASPGDNFSALYVAL